MTPQCTEMEEMLVCDFVDLINERLITSSYKKGRAIFPDWTHKIPSKQSCSHCQQPLFLAFRDSDLRPVLTCAVCERLYLSKQTKPLLVQARELVNGRKGNSNVIPKISPKATTGQKHTNKERSNSIIAENPLFDLVNSNVILQDPTNRDTPKRYTLKFSVDTHQTRTLLLDALQTLVDLIPDRCELLQRYHTLLFRADPSISKSFVKTFLQIVGQVCGFNCSFDSLLNSKTLLQDQLTTLRSILIALGTKWNLNSMSSLL